MHDFDAAQQDARAAKILESEHESRASLDRPVIRFNDIVEILGLANLDRRLEFGVFELSVQFLAVRAEKPSIDQ